MKKYSNFVGVPIKLDGEVRWSILRVERACSATAWYAGGAREAFLATACEGL